MTQADEMKAGQSEKLEQLRQEQTGQFPALGSVFSEAWDLMVSKLGNVVGLYLVYVGIWLVLLLGLVLLGIALVLGTGLVDNIGSLTNPIMWGLQLKRMLPIFGVLLGLFVVIAVLLGMGAQAAFVLMLGEKKLERGDSVVDYVFGGFGKVWSLLGLSLMVGLLVFGGFMLLVIPGLLIGMFLMFAAYEVILEDKPVFEALRYSTRIATQQFGEIFVRLFLFYLVNFIFSLVFGVFTLGGDGVELVGHIVRLMFNLGWSIYSIAFGVVLYRQARAITDLKTVPRIGWMYGLSLVGWLLGIVLVVGIVSVATSEGVRDDLVRFFSEEVVEEMRSEMENSDEVADRLALDAATVPTSCGLGVLVPQTTDETSDREWLFEQVSLVPEAFPVVDTSVLARDFTNAVFVSFRSVDEQVALTGDIGPTAYNIYCIDNKNKIDLTELVALIQASRSISVISVEEGMLGELEGAWVSFETANDAGDVYTDSGFVAAGIDENRLVFVRRWGVEEEEQMAEVLREDLRAIGESLHWRGEYLPYEPIEQSNLSTQGQSSQGSMGGSVSEEFSTLPNAGCIQYPIYEGRFVSNKCYTSSDYDELSYYMREYRLASARLVAAEAGMEFTCDGQTEIFQDACERSKQEKAEAEEAVNGYMVAIEAIISRGT